MKRCAIIFLIFMVVSVLFAGKVNNQFEKKSPNGESGSTEFVSNNSRDSRSVPNLIDYQGRFTDSNDIPITSSVSITFAIYDDATSGSNLWDETHSSVTPANGLVHVQLGSVDAFGTSLFDGSDLWLSINVNGDGEMTPRLRIVSVPYALYSENTANTDDADADPTNEFNTDLNLNGSSLEVTDDGGTLAVELGTLSGDNDWTILGDDIYSGVIGNVGIGTPVPSAKLEVAGHISITGLGNSVFLGQDAGLNDDLSNNNNTFIGAWAGYENTIGYYNCALGYASLHENTEGDANNAFGNYALFQNTTGNSNAAFGYYTLDYNSTGSENTAMGNYSLYNNSSGGNNTAIGYQSGYNTNNSGSIYIGNKAGFNNTSNDRLYIDNSDTESPLIYGELDNDILAVNGKLGIGTMTPGAELEVAGRISIINTGGSVFLGHNAGANDDLITNNNTAIGTSALSTNVSGTGNTAVGVSSLKDNTGVNNSALGKNSLRDNATGGYNVAIGAQALQNMETGSWNVGIGNGVNFNSESGNNNTMIGHDAGHSSNSVDGCVFIGYKAGYYEESDNTLVIENSNSESPLIYGEFDNDIVSINGNLGIGTESPDVKLHVIDGSDATITGGGYLVTGSSTDQNIVLDENEIMARNNGGTSSLQLQRDGGSLSVHYGLGEINEFRIRDDGKTGIGVSYPNSKLHVNTVSGEDGFRVQITGSTKLKVSSNGSVVVGYNTTTPTYALQLQNNFSDLYGKGIANAWETYSDERVKSNQRGIEYGLKEVMQLQPKSYHHHSSSTSENGDFIMVMDEKVPTIGFIAQEMQQVIPEAVSEPQDDSKDLWSMDYDKLIPVLTKAIQEQQDIIEKLSSENKDFRARIEKLENK